MLWTPSDKPLWEANKKPPHTPISVILRASLMDSNDLLWFQFQFAVQLRFSQTPYLLKFLMPAGFHASSGGSYTEEKYSLDPQIYL